MDTYCQQLNIKLGIEPDKHPDKEWLILAIATLSGGKDEIFEPTYMPNRDLFGLQRQQVFNPGSQVPIPMHLLGFGKGKHLKIGGISKEERVANQLKMAENRVKKQQDKQERLKQ